MKKSKLILAAVLGLALAMGASAKTFITIGSGGTTGTYYPTAVGIAKIINENLPDVKANAISTGGSVYNAGAIQTGDLQMTMIQNDIAYYAFNGIVVEKFIGKPADKLRGMATIYPEPVHVFARKDSGITSIADFKGKKVYVGDIGSGVEQNAKQVLEAYGLTFDDLGTAVRGKPKQAAQLLQDGRIDAMFYTAGVGSSAIAQAALTTDIVFLPIEFAKIDFLKKKYPFYAEIIIPAGSYKGQDKPFQTVAVKATLAASADLDADVVYQIAKLVFKDKVDQFKAIKPVIAQHFSVEKALDGMPIPLHKGAAKFFEEEGIAIPDAAKPID